jgi:hypothetical protein
MSVEFETDEVSRIQHIVRWFHDLTDVSSSSKITLITVWLSLFLFFTLTLTALVYLFLHPTAMPSGILRPPKKPTRSHRVWDTVHSCEVCGDVVGKQD